MKHFSSKLFLATLMAFLTCAASAQEFKIGIVNIDRIFREANSAKAAQAKLEQEFGKREKDLGDVGTQLKTLADKLSDKIQVIIAPPPTNGDFIGSALLGGSKRNASQHAEAAAEPDGEAVAAQNGNATEQ